MYGFNATYTDYITLEERTQLIEVDENVMEIIEKDVFMIAMGRAYDNTKMNETFDKIELIYC